MDRISLEELLEHQAWVRRLALSLVADGPSADDAVQETWIRAMHRGPGRGVPVRKWLGRVVRNVVKSSHRAHGRRGARERAAARPEGEPSVDASIERARLQAAVVDAVQHLDERYRAVVVLHYYDDLPPREVAKRLDLPVETVRKRLQRARQQLQVQLGESCGPDWKPACLAAFTLPSTAAVATGATAGTATTGVVIMSWKTKAAIVAVLGAVGWFVWPDDPVPIDIPVVTAQGAGAPTVADARVGNTIGGDRAGAVEVASIVDFPADVARRFPAGRFGWHGRVLGPDGEPEPRAEILVFAGASTAVIPTDDAARFRWMKQMGRKVQSVTFAGSLPGFASKRVSARADNPPTEVIVRLESGPAVTVRLVEEGSEVPVADVLVTVKLNGAVARDFTDELGCVHLPAVGNGAAEIRIAAAGPVFGEVVQREIAADRPEVRIEVRRYPRRGTIVAVDRSTRQPIADVRMFRVVARDARASARRTARLNQDDHQSELVELRVANGMASVVVPDDEHGAFVLAQADGYFSMCAVVVSDTDTPLELGMLRTPRTAVQVVAAGEPVHGVSTITWSMQPIRRWLPRDASHDGMQPRWVALPDVRGEVRTDALGRAELPLPAAAAEPELFRLRVRGPNGRERDYGELQFGKTPAPPWQLDVAPARRHVRLAVRDAAGEPVAGIAVDATAMLRPRQAGYQDLMRAGAAITALSEVHGERAYGRTDEFGEFALVVPAPCRLGARVGNRDRGADVEELVDPGDGELVIPVTIADAADGLTITGRLTPRSGSLPTTRWRARLVATPVEPSDQRELASISTNGTFTFDNLQPGRYAITVPWAFDATPTVVDAGATEVQLTIPPPRTVRVSVVDAVTRELVPGVRARFRCGSATSRDDYGVGWGIVPSNDGVVFAENLCADLDYAEVSKDGYVTSRVSLVGLNDAALRDLVIALAPAD